MERCLACEAEVSKGDREANVWSFRIVPTQRVTPFGIRTS
jgi:hypothetical protein